VKSHAVRFWEIRSNRTSKGVSYTVRWTVAGREKLRTLARKALAERYRARLIQAADRGEAFDSDTGLPDSLARETSRVTWYEHACDFIDARWPRHAGKGRVSLVEGLTAVTAALVTPRHGAPDPNVLRRALRKWAFNPPRRGEDMPADIEAALAWLTRASLPLAALDDAAVISRALDACGRRLDGSAASAEYYRRRRRTLYAALKQAVRSGSLSANPLDGPAAADWKAPAVTGVVDRRRVPNPAQMRELLAAIGKVGSTQGPRLVALYGCMYYGMLRPSEAVSLRQDECHLPATGWGLIEFAEVRSAVGREWTDDGEVHEARAPKGGPKNAVRRVPVPPELIALLHEHIAAYGVRSDGLLFRSYRGRIYLPSTLWQVLQKARPLAFTDAQVASPLARRPYDFRHAGISWRLNSGVPGPKVAEWAGHSVEVLYRVYAHCLDGDDPRWYRWMEETLG
jgi:integrase